MGGKEMIYHGDCRDVMREMEAHSIDCVVADPPYGLSFMGKDWDHGIPGVEFWEAAYRVMKPGAHLLAFGGTRTFHRLTCAIEDAGFEIRDCMMWLYGSGFPKSHNLKEEWSGWGTALKPAWEPILVCRKPLEGTVVQNVLKWGCGALNIDESRIGVEESDPNHRRSTGNNGGADSIFGVGNSTRPATLTQGRWPANVILDEEAGEMLDGQSGISKSTAAPRNNGEFKSVAKNREHPHITYGHSDTGGASRFFYCAKASKRERGEGNNHPTVKPISLLQYLIKLVCPPNGTVLDPFMGSGSTLVAAERLGFKSIGIELEETYCEIARKRVEAEMLPLALAVNQ